jgi:DNA (cytosine-5)-methyltransferase 1
MRPIAIDLFAGAGGMSLGFEQAGFDIVAAVEKDPIHAAVHAFNFPNCATIAADIATTSGASIREAAKIGDRIVDCVFGGAPCQGFSLMGHRVLDDPRNALVKEFVRIVAEIAPRSFVFENVKGITVGKHRAILDELVLAFREIGYSVILPWSVLSAADFGVPQDRERLFLIGVRSGEKLPEYPKPTTRPAGTATRLLPAQGPSCTDALADLPDAERFAQLDDSDEVRTAPSDWGKPSAYAAAMRCMANDAWGFGHPRKWDPLLLTGSMRTEHTDISRRRFASTPTGKVEPISRLFRLPPDGVSNTLRAGTDSERGAFTAPRPIHFEHARLVTVREMARLHSFPDWFRFHETKWHGARQIGNAVPPLLARAVAEAVGQALGIVQTRPSVPVALGDRSLLSMDMKTAARNWSVAVSIGKRTHKSGAKKRKQHEIEAQAALAAE